MGRYEKFRDKRIFRRNMLLSAIIFLSLLGTGLSVSDSVTNSLMGREDRKAITAKFLNEDTFQLEVFGNSYVMNTRNIREDCAKIKNSLENRWIAIMDHISYFPGENR